MFRYNGQLPFLVQEKGGNFYWGRGLSHISALPLTGRGGTGPFTTEI